MFVYNVHLFLYTFSYSFLACSKYCTLCRSSSSGLSAPGKTRLDRERAKMCQNEMVSTCNLYITDQEPLDRPWLQGCVSQFCSIFRKAYQTCQDNSRTTKRPAIRRNTRLRKEFMKDSNR